MNELLKKLEEKSGGINTLDDDLKKEIKNNVVSIQDFLNKQKGDKKNNFDYDWISKVVKILLNFSENFNKKDFLGVLDHMRYSLISSFILDYLDPSLEDHELDEILHSFAVTKECYLSYLRKKEASKVTEI